MPSWNLHTLHANRLLKNPDVVLPQDFCEQSFVFGNYVPDILVGYMVKNTSSIVVYEETHFAQSHAIPLPNYQEFWDEYIEPSIKEGLNECYIGIWAHLVADCVYNTKTRARLAQKGIPTGEHARIIKQSDFRNYGLLHCPYAPVVKTQKLSDQAQGFPQYFLTPKDIVLSIQKANELMKEAQEFRQANNVEGALSKAGFSQKDPIDYQLFDEEWFWETGVEVDSLIVKGVKKYLNKLDEYRVR